MNIQIILWSILILPWLTLFFMRKEYLKRFMPVTLFTILTSLLMDDIAGTLNLFAVRQTVFPLSHINTYTLSLFPVATLWVFRFTYPRFWLYIGTNLMLDIVFNFVFMPWILKMGIIEQINFSAYKGLILTMVQAVLLFGYLLWLEDALVPAVKKLFSPILHPTAAKPVIEEEDGNHKGRK